MKIPRFLHHPAVLVFFTLLAIVFSYSLRKTAQKSQVSQTNLSILDQRVSNLARDIEQEQYELELAETSLAREKIIRNELLLQKPGEYILQLPEENLAELSPTFHQLSPKEQWFQLFSQP